MMYLVQGWKDGAFTGTVVTIADLCATMDTFTMCNVYMLRFHDTPLPVWIEQSFDFGVYVYDGYNNIMEMHFYNGTDETEGIKHG